MASQVSCEAILSRLRIAAAIEKAKPSAVWRVTSPSIRPELFEVDDDALAHLSLDGGDHQAAAGRQVDDLAGIFLQVRQHVAAEQGDRDAVVPPPFHLAPCEAGRFGELS